MTTEKQTPAKLELRERCLELAVKAEPQRATEIAADFLAFIEGQSRRSDSR
jgi:hypothetical protein